MKSETEKQKFHTKKHIGKDSANVTIKRECANAQHLDHGGECSVPVFPMQIKMIKSAVKERAQVPIIDR